MPTSRGTRTVATVVGGAVEVLGGVVVATVAGTAMVVEGAVDPGAASPGSGVVAPSPDAEAGAVAPNTQD